MESINQSIAAALECGRPSQSRQIITARLCMSHHPITLCPLQKAKDAMLLLLKHKISGAPVVEGNNRLVGMLSEIDCLRAAAGSSYDSTPFEADRPVRELMSRTLITTHPEMEIFSMIRLFEHHSIRKLPVVEEGVLIGLVSRRDILLALQRIS